MIARLDEWLLDAKDTRWVFVTGGPGMGKSAVLAAWLARREAAGDAVLHHFIRRAWANCDDPEAIVGWLRARAVHLLRAAMAAARCCGEQM